MFETLDVELASHLARAKGLGLRINCWGRWIGCSRRQRADVSTARAADRKGPPRIEHIGEAPRIERIVEAARAFTARVTDSADAPRTLTVREPLAPTTESTAAAATSATNFTDVHDSTAHNVRPVHGEVTSAFGWRRDPFTNKLKFHQGVDLRAAYGQEVQAAGAGTVVFSGDQGGYGTTVVVEHQDGTRTRYAHLSATLVRKGDQVGAGEPVGRAGQSGRATGTHLHFEVIGRNGRRVEPQQWASSDTRRRTLPPGMDEHSAGRSGD